MEVAGCLCHAVPGKVNNAVLWCSFTGVCNFLWGAVIFAIDPVFVNVIVECWKVNRVWRPLVVS